MKITVVGSGNNWTKEPNSSYLIERDDGKLILIDVGYGTTKQLEGKIDYSKLDTLILTHYHEDHFADFLPLFIKIRANFQDRKVNVIAPKHFLEKAGALLGVFDYQEPVEILNKYLNVREFSKEEAEALSSGIDLDGYVVRPYPVEHIPEETEGGGTTYNNNIVCFGYTVAEKSSGMVAGFSGDTQDCDNLKKIIEASDVLLVDAGSVNRNDGIHLSYEEYLEYKKKYSGKKFYATHVGGRVHSKFDGKWSENPRPGTQIYVGSEPPYSLGD